tara:strand:- start:269 stop:694 length:426 start_codon:yes stop_codon:yes gene_type:complete
MKSHLTAISRNKASAPMTYLAAGGFFNSHSILDYGCGRGFDADAFGLVKFDPHYFPQEPEGKFDIITCNYVLNVRLPSQQNEVIAKIHSLLAVNGVAYITVRRDVKNEGFTSRGTYQCNVVLDLPVVVEKKGQFCIYKLTK